MADPAEQRGGWLANAALAAVTCFVPYTALLTRGKRASEARDRSASMIQRSWRGYRGQSRYLRLRRAAIRTQARWRAKRQRERHLALREAAILAQKHWRAAKAGRQRARLAGQVDGLRKTFWAVLEAICRNES